MKGKTKETTDPRSWDLTDTEPTTGEYSWDQTRSSACE